MSQHTSTEQLNAMKNPELVGPAPKLAPEHLKRRVRRYSPDRLLRQPVVLIGGTTVSVEKHKGRKMVRLDEPVAGSTGDVASVE